MFWCPNNNAVEVNPRTRLLKLLPMLAGLVVAAAVAFTGSAPPGHYSSWAGLLGFAVGRIFAVSVSCALTMAILSAVISPRADLEQQRWWLQASRAALWLVPLSLFLRSQSSWALVGVIAFAMLATPSLEEVVPHPPDSYDGIVLSLQADELPLFPKFRPQFSIVAALCAESGVLAFFAGYVVIGTILLGLACCAWTTWSVTDSTAGTTSLRQSDHLFLTALALVFTVGALIPYLQGASGLGLGSAHRHAVRVIEVGDKPGRHNRAPVLDQPSRTASEGNTGIILWPEKEVHTKLVAPTPIDLRNQAIPGQNANPLVIPFDGVYWFFESPDLRPPKTSRQAHASPDKVEIRSTDRRPLSIEAHDYLGSLINLDCCSRIQVSIRNADRYPDSVSLEVILLDTSKPNRPSQSLGALMVKSTRPWRIYERPPAVSETLNFPVPARASLRQFDEVWIVFRLDRARADSAARIAIDHFVLVPRGL